MKKVVVCYKWLLDDADIRVNEKSRQLDFEKAKFKLNEYDRNGIEAGVQVKADGIQINMVFFTLDHPKELVESLPEKPPPRMRFRAG